MKKPIGAIAVVVLLLAVSGAMANVIMTVDIANPNNVIVRAVNDTASNSVSFTVNQGVILKAFLKTAQVGSIVGAGTGTFAPSVNVADTLNTWNTPGIDFRGFADDDLRFYGDPAEVLTITSGSVPFVGTSAYDLSSIASLLPSVGTIGDLRGLNSGNYDSGLIGQWEVVPEPATITLLAAGGIVLLRRKFKK